MTIHMPSLRDVHFRELSIGYGEWLVVEASYETPAGRMFSCDARVLSRRVLPSERSAMRTRLYREAFNGLQNCVQDFRAAVEPIPNN